MKDVIEGNGSSLYTRQDLVNADSVISFDEYTLTIDGVEYTFRSYDGEIPVYENILN